MQRGGRLAIGAVAAVAACATPARGFDITINYSGSLASDSELRLIFEEAEAFWEQVIQGYQPGITFNGPTISASVVGIDGAGGVLGSAGPTSTINRQASDGEIYTLAYAGTMRFDSADVDNYVDDGRFARIILHEMGHVLGLGTLWDNNGFYTNGTGQYTGTNALASYRAEFDPTATYVPVELGGGSGTANGHWDEVNGGAALTGVTDLRGRDRRDELMTGWLSSSPFTSTTTLSSLVDLGFDVSFASLPITLPTGSSSDLDLPLPLLGDFYTDGQLTNDDVLAFTMALIDAAAYDTQYQTGLDLVEAGDFSGDGLFNFDDIQPFADRLVALGLGSSASLSSLVALVPEPGTLAMLMLSLVGLNRRRRLA